MDSYPHELIQALPAIQNLGAIHKHDESINCEECGAEFQNLRGLRLHEGKIHSLSEKNIQCSHCQKLFKTKYSLRVHVKQVHERATREGCPKCSKILYNKYMLKKHIKKAHPPEAAIN